MKSADLVLEWLSIRLPLASGNVHSNLLKKYLRGDIKTVLDVGCGRGVFPAYRQAVSTGVDIYADSLDRAIHYGNYQTLKQMDVTKLDFPDKSFDAVTSIEVIEHLEKEDGQKMMEKMEEIARKLVIISTPWGFDPCPMKDYNPLLFHRSGWTPEEFEERGYKIIPDYTMKLHAWNNYPPLLVVLYGLTVVLNPLIRMNPAKYCNGFVAVKYL